MKIKKLLLTLLYLPFIGLGQDDENTYQHLFLQGQIVLTEDRQEIYLETQNCTYAGKYYFGAIADENTGSRKENKKAKKKNKQKKLMIQKYIKKASKAPNGIMTDIEVEGIIGDWNGRKTIHPLKIREPIKLTPPIKTEISAIDNLAQLNYETYLQLQELKKRCKFISFTDVTDPNDKLKKRTIFMDPNCIEIDTPDLTLIQTEAMRINKLSNEVNSLMGENITAMAAMAASFEKLRRKLEKLAPTEKVQVAAQLSFVTIIQTRLLSEFKRVQEIIKENETILEDISLKLID